MIFQGLKNGNIANVLHIRLGTVKTHTRNIYRKVRVRSKIGMLLRFVTDTRDFFGQYEGFRSAPLAVPFIAGVKVIFIILAENGNGQSAVAELEQELIEINTTFWEG